MNLSCSTSGCSRTKLTYDTSGAWRCGPCLAAYDAGFYQGRFGGRVVPDIPPSQVIPEPTSVVSAEVDEVEDRVVVKVVEVIDGDTPPATRCEPRQGEPGP